MIDTTTDNDIYHCVEKWFNELKVDWNNVSNITTDGAPAMLGVKVGLVSRLKSKALTFKFKIVSLT